MTDYLNWSFEDSPAFVNTFDELPLWSAYFGIFLLKHLRYRRNISILDIGSGAGFPLLELAGRFGNSCHIFGIDTWANANDRARQKIGAYGVANVQVIDGSADAMPFADASMDLIISNLGINNFDNPAIVFDECARVLKPGGKLSLTTNLNGHWHEFYQAFARALVQAGQTELLPALQAHQENRGSVGAISGMFENAGLKVTHHATESFEMNFADGSAFLNHHFVKLGWLSSWKELAGPDMHRVFTLTEAMLNDWAEKHDGLTLTVPMVFIEGVKE
jgi:arsenite methyltransferase